MQDKSYYDNNDTDPYVIKTTTTRDLFPHSIRLRDECAYRSRSSTPPDLSNIPIYTYSNTDRSTPARSADSHKSPFRTPRRTNLSRTFRTPSRTRSTSVPNKKLFVFVLLKSVFACFERRKKEQNFPNFKFSMRWWCAFAIIIIIIAYRRSIRFHSVPLFIRRRLRRRRSMIFSIVTQKKTKKTIII